MTNTNDHGREKGARSGDEKGFEQRFETGPGETMNMDDRQHDLLCRSHFGEELTAAERAELDAALATSEELRAAQHELEATAALVRGALGDDITLDAARRTAVLDAARAGAAPAPGGGKVLRFIRYASLPLAASFAGMMWWGAQQDAVDPAADDAIGGVTTTLADAVPEEELDVTDGLHSLAYSGEIDVGETNGQLLLAGLGYSGGAGTPGGAPMAESRAGRAPDVRYVGRGGAVPGVSTAELQAFGRGSGGPPVPGAGGPAGVYKIAQAAPSNGPASPVPSTSDAFYLGRGTETLGVGGGAGGAPVHRGSPGGGAYRGPGDTTPPTSGGSGGGVAAPPSGSPAGPAPVLEPLALGEGVDVAFTRTFTSRDPGVNASPPAKDSPAPGAEGATPQSEPTPEALRGIGYVADDSDEIEQALERLRSATITEKKAAPEPRGRSRRLLEAQRRSHSSTYRPLHCEPRPLPQERPRDMFFRFWGDNPFVIADADALSTFAADVDTASFALAERMLKEGHVPAREQIRTEEFVNFLTPDLAPPTEGTFAVHSELSASPFGGREDRYLLRVGVRAKEVARDERPPLALTFVVDVSGSMENGGRLELVKHALRLLTAQLDGRDTIAIVAFSNEAREVLRATPASRADLIETALFGLSPGGGTNAEAGIRLGYERAALDAVPDGAQRRVVFLSDGVANIGQTDQSAIAAEVARRVEEGVFLNTIGVGLENFNDVFLEQLANDGQGVCDYVADAEGARRAIVERFTGGFVTVAKDVKIQVEFDPAVVLRWRQLGYENRAVADRDFRNDKIDAGEIGAGHQVTCLYELELSSTDARREAPLATARVRYAPVDGSETGAVIEREHRVDYAAALAPTFRGASHGFRRAALAAQLAEILRGSVHTAGDTIRGLGQECAALLQDAMDEDTARVAELVKRSMDLGVDARPAFDPADPDAAHRRAYYESLIESLGGAAPDRDTEDLDALLDSVQKLLERSRRRKAR